MTNNFNINSPKPFNQKTQNKPVPKIHHRIRTFFSSLFGIAAVLLVISSILVLWLNSTLTNNSVFVSTIAPLSTKPAIQNFIVSEASSTIVTGSSNVQGLANQLLTSSEIAKDNPTQLNAAVKAAVNKRLQSVVSSDTFSEIWKSAVKSSQAELISGIKSESGSVTINLHPAVLQVIQEFQTAALGGNSINIPSSTGVINISGTKLNKIRSYYNLFQKATWSIIIITIVAVALCIWLSVHHARTFRRISLVSGILTLLIAIALSVPSIIISNSSAVQTKAVIVLATTLVHNLFLFCLIFGIICIVSSVGSKVYSSRRNR